MNTNMTPKFSKVELLVKNEGYSDRDLRSKIKIEFLNCSLIITGDFIIVVIDGADGDITTTNNVYNLKDIEAYKTHA